MKGSQNKGILGPFSHRVAQMIVCLLNANNNFPAAPKKTFNIEHIDSFINFLNNVDDHLCYQKEN